MKKIMTIQSLCCLLGLLSILCMSTQLAFAQETDLISIQNDFIKIIANNHEMDRGRFAIETTKGDPKRETDDNQPLIFGRPKPWTSYTTLLIDGVPYVFGGSTKKRAGKMAKYGNFVAQTVTANSIITVYQYGEIRVRQELSFFRNPLSKVLDCAQIRYVIENQSDTARTVGVRIMMDTLLGKNDGAPFRIGTSAFQSEQRFNKKELTDYWQTFDSLSSPTVIGQGFLSAPEKGIVAPDRMYLVNWGTLADNPWDFVYETGRSFVRIGETEKDTALALYWEPNSIPAKGTISRSTLYGLGGVSLSAGALSLGLAAPAEISSLSSNPMLIVGYLMNTGGYDSKNTVAKFELPEGFKVVSGSLETKLDVVGTEESRQVAIQVLATNALKGTQQIKFKVTSDTLEANNITRNIEVLGSPKLEAKLLLPTAAQFNNKYFDAKVQIKNPEALNIYDLQAELKPSPGLEIPEFETSTKRIGTLKAGESTTATWKIRIKDKLPKAKVSVALRSSWILPIDLTSNLNIVVPKSAVVLSLSEPSYKVGHYGYLSMRIKNPGVFTNWKATLELPNGLHVVRYSAGAWLLETKQTNTLQIVNSTLRWTDVFNNSESPSLDLGKLHFRAEKPGIYTVWLTQNSQAVDKIKIEVKE